VSNEERYNTSMATTILVLGILGITVAPFIAPVAWWMGNNYHKQARESGLEPDSNAKTGQILGIVGTVILSLIVIGMAMVFLFILLFFVIYIIVFIIFIVIYLMMFCLALIGMAI
jgi:hypothetical protein